MEKVMVLLSSYNGEQFIGEQIDSIFAQEGVDVFLFVRDDGSKDKTVSVIREYKKKYDNIEIEEGNNLGFVKSFMSLVYKCADNFPDFNYFAFSDQDDVWLKDKLITAVNLLKTCKDYSTPNLCFGNALAVDTNLNPLFECCSKNPTITKPTCLLRYFMLGCTMVFNRTTVQVLNKYRPKGNISMHDLWLNQTCLFLGEIVYDSTPHILYRQHGNNTAGVGNDLKKRWKRLMKSLKTYGRRHFRELNAKNLLSAYEPMLSKEDKELISIVADYKKNFKNRIRILRNKEINMGSRLSDFAIKVRIILGLL